MFFLSDLRFQMYIRLFITMVVLTVLYAVSFMIAILPYDHWITILGDICDTLHGVIVFILFVLMRKNVLLLLKERFAKNSIESKLCLFYGIFSLI